MCYSTSQGNGYHKSNGGQPLTPEVNMLKCPSTWKCNEDKSMTDWVNGCRTWWPEGPHEADGGLKDSRLQKAEISASQLTTKWKLQMFMRMPFKTHSGSCWES